VIALSARGPTSRIRSWRSALITDSSMLIGSTARIPVARQRIPGAANRVGTDVARGAREPADVLPLDEDASQSATSQASRVASRRNDHGECVAAVLHSSGRRPSVARRDPGRGPQTRSRRRAGRARTGSRRTAGPSARASPRSARLARPRSGSSPREAEHVRVAHRSGDLRRRRPLPAVRR
jgi:hypothetical protein